jgi:protease-4
MPTLSFFNNIFREPWMLEPQTAAAQRHVLMGVLMGLEFAPESGEVQASIDHRQSAAIPKGRKVNLLNLEGTMLRDDAGCGMVGTRTMASLLREADADKSVIGHILRIDSGGGAANSVPDLAEAIQSCQKPVVGFIDGYMCSAAMYVGSYCKHIMANRDDNRVGCIGTVIQIADFPKKATDSEGMLHLRIYADGSEDKNGEFESALEGDFKLIKERVLNPTNEKFKADIRKNRPATREDQLTGRTYMAKEVLGTLIDSLGNFDAAVVKVVELSNINIQKMEGLEHLQAVPGCANLEMVEGTVDLNQEQLEAVDSAIGTEKALVQTKDKTISEQADEIARLKQENASTKESNEAKDKEIASLKATIEELNKKPTPPAQAVHNGNPVPEEGDNDNPEEFCENLMKKIYG